MTEQVRSRERVASHGEVFTSEREVNAMLDLVKQETERVDSRFLEPACGDGNFLAEILRRKLEAAKKRATPPRRKKPLPLEFERQSVIAVTSVYGIEILYDNVLACRERLYNIWNEEYEKICKKEVSDECRDAVRFILSRNIVCGDALHFNTVDENGNATKEPIVFSEWTMRFRERKCSARTILLRSCITENMNRQPKYRKSPNNLRTTSSSSACSALRMTRLPTRER